MMPNSRQLTYAVVLTLSCTPASAGQLAADELARSLEAVASLPGEPSSVTAAGITRTDERILTVERGGDVDGPEKRLVIVGGLDGSGQSARSVIAALRWFKSEAPASLRREWVIVALPCAYPAHCSADDGRADTSLAVAHVFPPEDGFYDHETAPEPRYAWRWVAFQAPDLVLEVRSGPAGGWEVSRRATAVRLDGARPPEGSLAAALAGDAPSGLAPVAAVRAATDVEGAPAMLRAVLEAAASLGRSPLRNAWIARTRRAPVEVATLLANRYPESPGVSYIPSVAWSNTLRLADRLGDDALVERVRAHMAPFLSGEMPTIAEPYRLTSLAGHFAFLDFASRTGSNEALKVGTAGAEFILPQSPSEIVRFPRAWTDDMFMATSVLARMAARTGDARYSGAVGRLLTTYAAKLQRPDGLFIHAVDGPHPWGRGNGFALLGLTEALTHLPEDWPERARVLEIYRRHVQALAQHQAPDGMWRQVVDEPGSYRELTVTAMTTVAVARGVRLGWLDEAYRAVVENSWRGLAAHVAEDGALVDVCRGTGAGETKRYYLDRGAIIGPDDRGGAMALWAAMEMDALRAVEGR